jgi:peptidoglycan/LPS O-acetylase OafA/YrhL
VASADAGVSEDAVVRAPPPGNPRFPLFDSCRGLAALSILLFHAGEIGGGNDNHPLGYVGGSLAIGVPIFFAISGFLLYRPFVNARLAGARRPSLRSYARRRVLRIVPAYWVALTALAILAGWSEVFSADFWRYYGFAQIYDSHSFDGGISVAWTLCIEVTFYALLPFFALVMDRVVRRMVRREILILLALGLASGVLRAYMGESHHNYGFPTAMLPSTFLWFVPGMMLAVWSVAGNRVLDPRHGGRCWLIAGGGFVLFTGLAMAGVPRYVSDALIVPLIAFFLLTPAVVEHPTQRTVPQRVLGNRVLLWLGLVSYGIYLYHATLMAWLEDHDAARIFPLNHWIGLVLVTLAFTATVAGASWYIVERPALRWKPEFRRRRRPAPVVAQRT